MRNIVKKFNDAIDTLKLDEAEKMLPTVMSVIDDAASKGVIHKNTAANKKSRLSARLSGVKSGKIVIDIKITRRSLRKRHRPPARRQKPHARRRRRKCRKK